MGAIPSPGPASSSLVMASTFAPVSNCRHPQVPWDVIQMCKSGSEQERGGIRIKLLGKALVLCCGSVNRAKS